MATFQTKPVHQVSSAKTAQPKRHVSPMVALISGGTAGAVEASITYPFEFAKTRVQLSRQHANSSSNPFAVLRQVVAENGVRSVYAGCSTLILGTTFKAGVRFLTFDTIRKSLVDTEGHLSASRGVLAGMLAGCVESVVAVTPTERIKTALIDDAQTSARQYRGGFHATTTLVRSNGISELYRGLLATTIKQSATSAVRMGSYSALKEMYQSKTSLQPNSSMTFLLGATAGVITVYATQPFDTIKTRAQSVNGASATQAVREVFSEMGARGFWSGSTMRLGRLVFSGGIVFTVYEWTADFLTSGFRM